MHHYMIIDMTGTPWSAELYREENLEVALAGFTINSDGELVTNEAMEQGLRQPDIVVYRLEESGDVVFEGKFELMPC